MTINDPTTTATHSPVSLGSARPRVRLIHLYDEFLNIYADRGNVAVLVQRAAWRGIDLSVLPVGLGDQFDPSETDLIYVGGGQDRDQAMIADTLVRDTGAAIRAAVGEGAALLAVCGGYQLLGEQYIDADGVAMPGVELFDATTTAAEGRLVGNAAVRVKLPAIGPMVASETIVTGFENHAGRTTLGSSARPFGAVQYGRGNDGRSGTEGVRLHHAVGTYLHGPLLPRNPVLADWILAAALAHAHGPDAVQVLLDTSIPNGVAPLEQDAHRRALNRARNERKS